MLFKQLRILKKDLEKIGLLKRELIGTKGKQIVFLTLDLEWKKDMFMSEFDEYFNDIKKEEVLESKESIDNELKEISRLNNEGNISKENLAKRLNDLSYKIKAEDHKENENIPIEDINKLSNFIMNTKKMQDKVAKGTISDEVAYTKFITNSIKDSSYNGTEDYYKGLQFKELSDNLSTLNTAIAHDENEIPYKNRIMFFIKVRLQDNVYIARYENKSKSFRKDFIINHNKISCYLLDPNSYSKPNKELLENYSQNIKILIEKNQNIVKQE